MSGGISISPGEIGSFGGIVYSALSTGDTAQISALVPQFGPYRPSVWSQPALTMITVPAIYAQQQYTGPATNVDIPTDANGVGHLSASTSQAVASPTLYVFDAVFNVTHSQPLTITKHPVQSGSNIADHAYLNPARVSMGIGMSEAQDSYAAEMWSGGSSKSVNAFTILDGLRAQRIPLTVTTRLKTYTNMLIVDARADDTVQTRYGLKAVIELEQIFVATVAEQTNGVSARQQTTDNTNQGSVSTLPVPAGATAQNKLPSLYTNVPDPATIQANYGSVQGAGTWSSNNTGGLAGLYASLPIAPTS